MLNQQLHFIGIKLIIQRKKIRSLFCMSCYLYIILFVYLVCLMLTKTSNAYRTWL